VKIIYDSINHTRIPKEVLPDWACRGISGTKGYCLLSKGTYQQPVQEQAATFMSVYWPESLLLVQEVVMCG